jgi:hypothetical protein
MFALIDTKGANHIAMLEQNAVFINKGYNSIETVTPVMSIQLGNKVEFESYGQELTVTYGSDRVLDESFVLATPEVYVSYKKTLTQKDTEIERLRTELAHTKQQFQDLQDRINDAAD